ncbi:MAG: ATP-binding cassette domain-containing protein [Sporosarcina sp.]
MLDAHLVKNLPDFKIDVNIKAAKGEVIVLFGSSGSGKTTCLDMIAGLVHPDSGHIRMGENTCFSSNQKPCPAEKRNVGYVMQDYALFPHMTADRNVQYGMKSAGKPEKSLALLDQFGIRHLRNAYPHEMSGGEKQRTTIARALAAEPNLLLLDEPLSALDDKARHDALTVITDIQRDLVIPIIMVTHNWTEAEKVATSIYKIEKGRLI